jgi:hypothetical protein
VASQRVMIKLITATLQTGTLSQPSSHQGECPQALDKMPPQMGDCRIIGLAAAICWQLFARFCAYLKQCDLEL